MTFEIFVYRAQMFAAGLQNRQPQGLIAQFKIAGGALITQFLMGLCFAKIMTEGEKQWRKQKNAKSASKKSAQTKRSVPSAEQTSKN